MSEVSDVAVVGAGVIGLAVTAALLERGVPVTVIGPRMGDHRAQATRAAGAMLSTFSEIEAHHDPARVDVETRERIAATQLWPEWLARINAAAGTDVQVPAGTWVIAPAGRTAQLRPIAAAARAAGHVAEDHDATEIPGLVPPAGCAAALWLPTEAHVDSAALMNALGRALSLHPHCVWLDTTATTVEPGHVTCADGSHVRAGDIVLAAGTAIPGLLPAGRDWGVPSILAGRGVSALLRAPRLRLEHVVRTPNAAFACGVHLVPRADGTLYLGGTNRLTTAPDPDQAATLDELALLGTQATELLTPALRACELLAPRVGLRPYTLDHLPLLGQLAEPSLLLATATYRCGILLAPRIAELIAEEIASPGALADHPYRAQRPMPVPDLAVVLDHGASALLEHLLQGGGHLPAGTAAEFVAFADLALRALGDEASRLGAPLRRLWASAPVVEALPSLFALARRLEGTRP
jgi:glycine oxidase